MSNQEEDQSSGAAMVKRGYDCISTILTPAVVLSSPGTAVSTRQQQYPLQFSDGQRYNVMFAGTLIDMDGRIHYGTPWGRVRLNPK